MLQTIKNFLKKVVPPPTNVFNREIQQIIKLNKMQSDRMDVLVKQIEKLKQENDIIKITLDKLANGIANSTGYASEAVWAEIFNNVIAGSTWLLNTSFSPGRWAVGYPYLYVMYRILNEIRPKRILELGLGQSTRMIGQYVSSHENVEHFVVEHDLEWIDFFQRDFSLSVHSQIIQLDLAMEPYKEVADVRVYKEFVERFKDQKFDFICIDAPYGGDMTQYARVDVLKILPGCLAENFIVMIDDSMRLGEKQTIKEMQYILEQNGIAYKRGKYTGKKDFVILCSESLKFVCSI